MAYMIPPSIIEISRIPGILMILEGLGRRTAFVLKSRLRLKLSGESTHMGMGGYQHLNASSMYISAPAMILTFLARTAYRHIWNHRHNKITPGTTPVSLKRGMTAFQRQPGRAGWDVLSTCYIAPGVRT